MNASSLHDKTIRPGSLKGYSYYYSNRQLNRPSAAAQPAPKRRRGKLFAVVLLLLIVAVPVVSNAVQSHKPKHMASVTKQAPVTKKAKTPTPQTTAPAAAATTATGPCSGNTLDQFISVSISQRHLWACQGATAVYDSPVVTGMENYAADLTPTGTYHIYSKQTDLTLTGSDSTGSWNDPVSYWMPFLSNKYGTYGFHDATWRSDSDFGNIDPYSDQASHGCVELPIATAKWLYNWAQVGTTLTVNS